MPRYDTDAAGILHRHNKDTDLHVKSEVSDTIQHETLPILKYPCIIDPRCNSFEEHLVPPLHVARSHDLQPMNRFSG